MRYDADRPTPREATADAMVMAGREIVFTLRRPAIVLVAFVQPVLLVLLFRYVFGGALRPRPRATSVPAPRHPRP